MLKLASVALVALGTAGAVHACPSVDVGLGLPVVPRVIYAPAVYHPYYVGYEHEWRRGHEGYWHREHAHRYADRDWGRR